MSQILVIDDEPAICWSFEQALKDGGHEVRIASTAEEALREVTRSAPDVIVLDYRLPGMDGLAALKQLRIQAERVRYEHALRSISMNGLRQASQQAPAIAIVCISCSTTFTDKANS